jgi:short-chain 2-methylacyl-CoA dehydrogenase
MDFSVPKEISRDVEGFTAFLKTRLRPRLSLWLRQAELPREFFSELGSSGWYGCEFKAGRIVKTSSLREALLAEEFAKVSPGAAVAALAHADLGLMGLCLFGSDDLHRRYGQAVVSGASVMCLGNTESLAGSDAAAILTRADAVPGGWKLNGAKAYVTNGDAADLGVITAVADSAAPRNHRISMFLVDLASNGVRRTRLKKQVWIPSDLTRIELRDVFVPEENLLGTRGRGLQQVLSVFNHSRVPIAALTLGTAAGAFELAVRHALHRSVFGRAIADYQAKSFEIAELHAALEAARLVLWRACWKMDRGEDFREHASTAKYLAVKAARRTTLWAADICGAASVIGDHPIHRFPLDAWAASLGEGTQDIQKLIIFREYIKRFRTDGTEAKPFFPTD